MKTILALVLVALPWQGIEGYSLADTSLVQPGAAWRMAQPHNQLSLVARRVRYHRLGDADHDRQNAHFG